MKNKPNTNLKRREEEENPEVDNPEQENNPVKTPNEKGEEVIKDKKKENSTPRAEKVEQKSTQTVKTNKKRQPSNDSYVSHWTSGVPIVKQEEARHQFQFGQDMSGGNPPKENPSPVIREPPVIRDLLTGVPVTLTLMSTPLLPLLPTTAGLPGSPSVPSIPFSVGRYIDEIGAMERERNAKVEELMERDEDFESAIGFSDKYKLIPSSSEGEQSSGDKHGEDAEEDERSTTITEFLQEKEKSQNKAATSPPIIDTDQQEAIPPPPRNSPSPIQPAPPLTQTANTSAKLRLSQPIETVLANTPVRGKLVVLEDEENTTEMEEGLTSGYDADLTSGCEDMVDQITDILDQYNLDTESEILRRKLEQKEHVLLQRIRSQLEEIRRLSSSFYKEILGNTEIRTAMINPTSLAEETNERLFKLMEIEEKLQNSKKEIKRDNPQRKCARQAMLPKRSYKNF